MKRTDIKNRSYNAEDRSYALERASYGIINILIGMSIGVTLHIEPYRIMLYSIAILFAIAYTIIKMFGLKKLKIARDKQLEKIKELEELLNEKH